MEPAFCMINPTIDQLSNAVESFGLDLSSIHHTFMILSQVKKTCLNREAGNVKREIFNFYGIVLKSCCQQ